MKSELRDAMVEAGFSSRSIKRIERLLTMTPTDYERKKWEKVGIMEDGKIVADNDEIKNFSVLVIGLWDACFLGKLKRVKS